MERKYMVEDYSSLLSRVQQGLEKVSFKSEPDRLYEPIRYILEAGGKRIRPVFALMACQLFEGNLEEALYPALGLEYFHNFTLLHDDIMDCADMRRGRLTVHKKWDQNTAILSGDTMFMLSCKLIQKAPKDVVLGIAETFNNLAIGVCEGQQYDMDFETTKNVSMSQYMEMIRLKTAVLLAGSLEIGALSARASKQQIAHIYSIGEKLGIAFQLQDDWLDLYGDEAKFGKKIGSDIRERKKTYLYLKALECLPKAEAEKLKEWFSPVGSTYNTTCTKPACTEPAETELNNADQLSNLVSNIRDMYHTIGMKEKCMEDIRNWYLQAEKAIDQLPELGANKAAVEVFRNFAKDLLGRDF